MSKVKVTVLIAFNGFYPGDQADVEYDAVIKGWESIGLVRTETAAKEVKRAPRKARPSSAEPDDQGGESFGTGGFGAPGYEPGEDPGAR